MTVSLLTQPSTHVSAYRPITWEVTSNRTPFESLNVTAVADSGGGFCQFTVGTHTFKQFDIITGTGFTDTSYNVRAEVTGFSATTINVNIVFNATDTGIATRTNDNFKIKSTIYTYEGAQYTLFGQAADFDGNLRVSTLSPHGLLPGGWVKLAGTAYDGIHQVVRINAPDQFVIAATFTSSSGGTANNLDLLGTKHQSEIIVGATSLFRFNLSNFLQTVVSYDVAPLGSGSDIISPNDNSEKEYIVTFLEQYDDVAGLTKDQDSLDNDTGKQVFNTTLQHEDTQDMVRFIADSASKEFLTNQPNGLFYQTSARLRRDEEVHLHFITTESAVTFRLIEYDQVVGGSPTITNSASKTITGGRGIFTIDASTLLASTKRIDVRLRNNADTLFITQVQRFIIDERSLCNGVRLTWLNRLGGEDSFTFMANNERAVNSNRVQFTKGITEGFALTDRGRTDLGVVAGNSYSAVSDFLPRATAEWLEELATSPLVFRISGTDRIPVVITSTSVTTTSKEGMARIEIEYADANDIIVQNG